MNNCSKCNIEHSRNGRYCLKCHSNYMREWRKSHPLNKQQRMKMTARSYAHVYRDRGKIIKNNCYICDSANSQMHHEDYKKPIDVIWLCSPCHRKLHMENKHA